MIGREVSPETKWNSMREESTWIGKPWRRIELVVRRHFWKGEVSETQRDLTIHLGWPRVGLGVTFILIQGVLDYSDEPNQ